MKLLIYSGLLAALLTSGIIYYQKQVELLNQMQTDFAGISNLGVSGDYTIGTVKFKISNKSLIEGTLHNINIDVYLNGIYMGNVYQSANMVIPANGYNFISLDFKLSNAPLFTNLATYISDYFNNNTSAQMVFNFKGSVGVSSGILYVNVPVDENYTTTLNQMMS